MNSYFVGRNLDDLEDELDNLGDTDTLHRAQDLIYEAWEMDSRKERILLAQRALEISPDCADAYCLLAEEKARSLPEEIYYYEMGVKAGERAIGKRTFKEDKGHFWGIFETRPYMRARVELARCLWIAGQEKEAVAHLKEMLELNPNDNQGVRSILINFLFVLDDLKGVKELLDRYKEDYMAEWLYSKVLYLFLTEDTPIKARSFLKKATAKNLYIPDFLIGRRKIPRELPSGYTLGSEEEAIAYACHAQIAWNKHPGALAWLR